MIKRILLLFVIVYFSVEMFSCSGDDGGGDPSFCGNVWTTQLQSEITALANAGVAYSSDPTTATCNSYKAAFQGYINALKPFNGCNAWTSQQKKEFQDALAETD